MNATSQQVVDPDKAPPPVLGFFVSEFSVRNRGAALANVHSVTNSEGFVPSTDYFKKEVFSKDLSTYKIVRRGMLAYNPSRINVGSVAVQNRAEEVVVSPLYVVVSVDGTRLHPDYLSAFLHSPGALAQIRALTSGSVRDTLSFRSFAKLRLPVPSLEEQEAALHRLAGVRRLRDLREQQLLCLDNLAKSLFVEMFATKCPTVSIGDLFHVGGPKRIHKGEWTNKGVPFWKVSELTARITGEQVKPSAFISSSRYRQLKDEGFVPVPSDILVTARGTLGKFYVVRAEDEFYFQDGMITWLSRMSPRLNLSYFLAAVSSPEFRKQYEGKSPGTTVAYLSISQLSKLTVPLPPLSLQQAFAERVEAIDKSKFAIRKSLDELNRLYRSLLQQYFG